MHVVTLMAGQCWLAVRSVDWLDGKEVMDGEVMRSDDDAGAAGLVDDGAMMFSVRGHHFSGVKVNTAVEEQMVAFLYGRERFPVRQMLRLTGRGPSDSPYSEVVYMLHVAQIVQA
ncbi:hypothetical protein O3G_MSEX013533 [Manduca sexta]|uniref:Uncharacterized protein n=1 Tax=Manduca sexta TaxID=7130 RepID=A0A922CZF1_MANSE|nr:hypothetical protein O3G_MSEX013533 [Manduca sexta]